MLLYVTDLAPDVEVRARVTGAPAGAVVRIFAGTEGGPTCSPRGACVDMARPQLVLSGAADASGAVTFVARSPATLSLGAEIVFQAIVGRGPAAVVSNPLLLPVVIAPAPPPPGGNVLLVVLDDVGVDGVSAYGAAPGARTPTIDALAADGVRFTDAWSLPMCGPARAALMTGRWSRRTGHGTNATPPAALNELGAEQLTLAELVELSPWSTYDTALLGKWHLSTAASPSGLLGPRVQGFDLYTGSNNNLNATFWVPQPAPVDAGYYHWQRVTPEGLLVEEILYATTRVVDDAASAVAGPEPWLVVVALHAGHSPYAAPPPGLHTRAGLTDDSPIPLLFDAMVEAADTEIARLLGELSPATRARTTVIVIGDNGSELSTISAPYDPDRAKLDVYDGGVRVPLVVQGPGVASGEVSRSLVSVVDVFPTVAEIVGVDVTRLPGPLDAAAPLALDGESLVRVLADPDATVHEVLYTERFAPGGGGPFTDDRRAIRDDRYKLVYDAIDGREQLFEYVPGAVDEGPDLIACGLMTPAREAAREALRQRLDDLVEAMPYDAAPMAPDPTGWAVVPRTYDENCP